MKKAIILVAVFALAAFMLYKYFSGSQPAMDGPKDQSMTVAKSGTDLDASISNLLKDYYGLRDALVDWDTSKANQRASALEQYSENLSLKGLIADSSLIETAQNLATSIGSESKGFIGDTSIDEKRKDFNALTDEVYNLLRTVRYAAEPVFHIKCPMALKDSVEGYWLSNTNTIINPYLGKKHPSFQDKMLRVRRNRRLPRLYKKITEYYFKCPVGKGCYKLEIALFLGSPWENFLFQDVENYASSYFISQGPA